MSVAGTNKQKKRYEVRSSLLSVAVFGRKGNTIKRSAPVSAYNAARALAHSAGQPAGNTLEGSGPVLSAAVGRRPQVQPGDAAAGGEKVRRFGVGPAPTKMYIKTKSERERKRGERAVDVIVPSSDWEDGGQTRRKGCLLLSLPTVALRSVRPGASSAHRAVWRSSFERRGLCGERTMLLFALIGGRQGLKTFASARESF